MELPVSVISLEDTPQCASSLLEAAKTLGFVYITVQDSVMPASRIDRMWELSKQFFSSPSEQKEKCVISKDNTGWMMRFETLDPKNQRQPDFKEAFNLGEFKDGKAQQPLPASFADNETELNEFQDLCHDLCLKLLRLFAIALNIDPAEGGAEWFTPRHCSPSGTTLRFLYYPTVAVGEYSPVLDIRAGAHSDYGSITLLFQRPSEPGLEIHHPITKSWHAVPVLPSAILVNIGDLLSYWTAGLLQSTVHRVVFPEPTNPEDAPQDRYSIAYFCHPVNETPLTPIPSEVVRSMGERGANATSGSEGGVLTAEGHLKEKLRATYGWKGREKDGT
ncbi:hypothetical protein Q9L58_001393 [Maublancomyces gigas]|uniref:Fe2OG dioxygenase domain-containing protein n=1 Tax=Discina gigas TaxID=1032678 RepID=A0ABR3GV18_9PEZI